MSRRKRLTLPYGRTVERPAPMSAEGATDGSQGQAQRRPWIALMKRPRPEGERSKRARGRSSRYSLAPLQGAVRGSYRDQGRRASRLPLATFFCPYRATSVRSVAVVITLALVIIAGVPTAFIQNSHANTGTSHSMNLAETNTVLLPNRSPLVTFRILFMTGSAYDPRGKEGLASLTAAMLADGGSRSKTFSEITNAMYPMATSFEWQVDKEVLYTMIYPSSHAYGHQNMGAIGALEKMTIKDVRDFYQANFTQANLVIGLAGGYPEKFPGKVQTDFRKLPTGAIDQRHLWPFLQLKLERGTKIQIVQRETRSTAVSLGFPISVTRPSKDWPALAVVASYFGQHRSSNSYLYQRLREARGLNYGDFRSGFVRSSLRMATSFCAPRCTNTTSWCAKECPGKRSNRLASSCQNTLTC